MRSRGAAALVLCLLLAASSLAACGEDTDERDYASDVDAVAASFSEGVSEVSAQISKLDGLNLKSAGALLSTFADRVQDLAARVEDISPPDAVSELHDRLVTLLDDFGDRAAQAALALKAGDLLGGLPALASFAAKATDVGGRIETTVDEIRGKLGED